MMGRFLWWEDTPGAHNGDVPMVPMVPMVVGCSWCLWWGCVLSFHAVDAQGG